MQWQNHKYEKKKKEKEKKRGRRGGLDQLLSKQSKHFNLKHLTTNVRALFKVV